MRHPTPLVSDKASPFTMVKVEGIGWFLCLKHLNMTEGQAFSQNLFLPLLPRLVSSPP